MSNKEGRLIYLAGGMEFASSDGLIWRRKASDVLKEQGLQLFNPYSEEPRLFEQGPVYDLVYKLDKEKDFDKYREIMSKIVCFDLGRIEKNVSDVLVKYDKSALAGAGTHAEISLAHYLGKPVYCWLSELTLREVPAWALGCFSSVDYTLEDTLDRIINDK